MGWLFVLPALFGIWKYRYWAYWKPVLWILGVLQLTALLFSASGDYPDIRGDGLVTAWLRWSSQGGAEVLYAAIGFIGAVALCLWLLRGVHQATLPPNPGPIASKKTPTTQKALETFGLIAGTLALSFAVGAVNNIWPQLIAPELYEDNAEASPRRPTIEQEIEAAARVVRLDLPKRLDDATTMTGVDAEGRTLVYHYSVSVELGERELRDFFNQTLLPPACAEPDMTAAMRDGASFAYSYTTSSGRQQRLTLDTASCAAGRAR
jgi:hypothetical protein